MGKKEKIRKTWSMTKKKILAVKMDIFSEKNVIQKSWPARNFSVPPNSEPGLRHWHTCTYPKYWGRHGVWTICDN